MGRTDPAYIGAHSGAGKTKAGQIEKRVHPIGPAGHEAVELAEGVPRPCVEAALLRKAAGKLHDHQRRGHKEKNGGDDPKADRRGAVVRRRGNPARAENRGDIEEQHIPKAHDYPKRALLETAEYDLKGAK